MVSTVKEICQETKWGREIPSVTFERGGGGIREGLLEEVTPEM